MKYLIICIVSLFISFIWAIFIILLLKKLHIKQNVSLHLNNRHLLKAGTPTMGGLIFIVPTIIIITGMIITKYIECSINLFLMLFIFISYALLGFIDDYLKVKYKNNKGISIILKFSIELVIASIFFTIFLINGNTTVVDFLFFKLDLKFLYGIFILFLFSACSNAVNITDGLDGLSSGLCIISFIFYIVFSFKYTHIIGHNEIAIFLLILCSCLISFMYYNYYPAKIFMGDVGSLSLGGVLACCAIILKIEFSLVFIGVIFIIETLSSFIQIIAIRYFKTPVFKKAPLHHHYEEIGCEEVQIVKNYYFWGLICLIISVLIYLNIS